LAETQWAVRESGLPIIFGSKLPGVLSFLVSIAILLRLNTSSVARGYLLFMLPMGLILFWNRSEPFLLMLVSIALLVKERNAGAYLSSLAMGVIGGVASTFKIHAVIYVFAVYLLTFFACEFSIFSLAFFGVGAAAAFCLAYMVPGVSLSAFFDYVRTMGSQGLSFKVLTGNGFFLALLFIPVWVLYREKRLRSLTPRQLFVLGGVAASEVFVAIIAGKPGAGVHHLLPFVAINACIIEMLLESREQKGASVVKLVYASAMVPVVVSMLTVISPMVKGWRIYSEARTELAELGRTYTDLAAGASDMDDYPYVFLRVLLSGPQLDYTAFMDLQYSGVDDHSFAMKLQKCEIMNIAVPRTGAPFSITNIYTGRPLMSDDVRMRFKENYELVKEGVYYNIYSCNRR
jgi:phage shock protein PspC (stress-responsive transcriptional regulator)